MKINNFRGELTDSSAKKEALRLCITALCIRTLLSVVHTQVTAWPYTNVLSIYRCPSISQTTISRTLDNPDDVRATDPAYSTEIALFNPDSR